MQATRKVLAILALAGLGGCTAQGAEPGAFVPPMSLPQAVSGVPLAAETTLTRIAVGSCNRQDQDQAFWDRITAADPQLFLMIGDNVYGDIGWDGGADLGTFRAAYASLAAEPRFAALRSRVPMMVTWLPSMRTSMSSLLTPGISAFTA